MNTNDLGISARRNAQLSEAQVVALHPWARLQNVLKCLSARPGRKGSEA